ncbi:Uncharacterised protein [Mycobacteroides abscessus]|nr:Uncharacterised protein [Mycobacteroides abscessus]
MVRPQKFRARPAMLKSMRDWWTRGPAVALCISASARAGMTLPGSFSGVRGRGPRRAPRRPVPARGGDVGAGRPSSSDYWTS